MAHKLYAGAGAAYGTAKSGIGIAGVGTFRPDLIMKVWRTPCQLRNHYADAKGLQSLIPVVMAGIIAVYSLVIAVLIAGDLEPPPGQNYSLFKYVRCKNRYQSCHCRTYFYLSGFMHLAAGLSVGLTGLAAGYAIGVVGDVVCQYFSAGMCRSRS